MNDAEKLLRSWRQSPISDGMKCEDALKVIRFLGMDVESNNEGHYEAFHKALLNSPRFCFDSITVNCHAFGVQGKAHSGAVTDILKVAKIIPAAQQEEQQNGEDD